MGEKEMLKALTGLIIAGAAALAIASPAAAAPVCTDGAVDAYGSYGSFASAGVDADQFCTGDNLQILSITNWPSFYVTNYGTYASIDGIYYSQEIVLVTVTDGTDTASYYLTINPHFS
jgi:hypothetical protein